MPSMMVEKALRRATKTEGVDLIALLVEREGYETDDTSEWKSISWWKQELKREKEAVKNYLNRAVASKLLECSNRQRLDVAGKKRSIPCWRWTKLGLKLRNQRS